MPAPLVVVVPHILSMGFLLFLPAPPTANTPSLPPLDTQIHTYTHRCTQLHTATSSSRTDTHIYTNILTDAHSYPQLPTATCSYTQLLAHSLHRRGTFVLSIGVRRGWSHRGNSRRKWWFRSRRVVKRVHLTPLCIGLRGSLFCTGATLSSSL